ncbi:MULTISPECIES: MucR family transcriptional regulator [unclassified Rhizobium]|uniref:MucR family transcriptional regulator n=1 Tax=unclassified Rhizobium TaxID=2613769 RepID=UPI0009E6DA06|nr:MULTISPECIES: MucR family transcriptional regulator [unclassified Rhizobium]
MSEQLAGQGATGHSAAGHGLAGHGSDLLVELTAEIVAAYVSNHVVPVSELPTLIGDVHNALNNTGAPAPVAAAVEKPKPAVSVRKSVQDGQITCLECGGNFKSLKRHLMTHHTLSPEDYREKWELPQDYPMVAPAYAEARSRLAREMGLGQRRKRAAK